MVFIPMNSVKLTEPTYELLIKLTQQFKFNSYSETMNAALHVMSAIASAREEEFNDFLARNTQSRREKSINVPGIERIMRK